ncbi:MAG TPA: hypothetical protein QGF02_00560 [Candidatus Babeliales bacterium]|nr:hypothetical protein [Candidatus Babeliales bacterium]
MNKLLTLLVLIPFYISPIAVSTIETKGPDHRSPKPLTLASRSNGFLPQTETGLSDSESDTASSSSSFVFIRDDKSVTPLESASDFDRYSSDGYSSDGYSSDGYSSDGYSSDGYSSDGYSSEEEKELSSFNPALELQIALEERVDKRVGQRARLKNLVSRDKNGKAKLLRRQQGKKWTQEKQQARDEKHEKSSFYGSKTLCTDNTDKTILLKLTNQQTQTCPQDFVIGNGEFDFNEFSDEESEYSSSEYSSAEKLSSFDPAPELQLSREKRIDNKADQRARLKHLVSRDEKGKTKRQRRSQEKKRAQEKQQARDKKYEESKFCDSEALCIDDTTKTNQKRLLQRLTDQHTRLQGFVYDLERKTAVLKRKSEKTRAKYKSYARSFTLYGEARKKITNLRKLNSQLSGKEENTPEFIIGLTKRLNVLKPTREQRRAPASLKFWGSNKCPVASRIAQNQTTIESFQLGLSRIEKEIQELQEELGLTIELPAQKELDFNPNPLPSYTGEFDTKYREICRDARLLLKDNAFLLKYITNPDEQQESLEGTYEKNESDQAALTSLENVAKQKRHKKVKPARHREELELLRGTLIDNHRRKKRTLEGKKARSEKAALLDASYLDVSDEELAQEERVIGKKVGLIKKVARLEKYLASSKSSLAHYKSKLKKLAPLKEASKNYAPKDLENQHFLRLIIKTLNDRMEELPQETGDPNNSIDLKYENLIPISKALGIYEETDYLSESEEEEYELIPQPELILTQKDARVMITQAEELLVSTKKNLAPARNAYYRYNARKKQLGGLGQLHYKIKRHEKCVKHFEVDLERTKHQLETLQTEE